MIKVGENTDDDQGKLDFSKVASIEGNDTTGYNIKIPKAMKKYFLLATIFLIIFCEKLTNFVI